MCIRDRYWTDYSYRFPCKMNPRPLGAVGRLKGADFVVALQCHRDFIEASNQSGTAARIDLEADLFSRRRCDRLRLEIDADAARPLGMLDLRRETIDDALVDHDGEDAVLKAIGEKYIAKA